MSIVSEGSTVDSLSAAAMATPDPSPATLMTLLKKVRRSFKAKKKPVAYHRSVALNDDILYLIVKTVDFDILVALSTTSHRIRDVCMPVLFRQCSVAGHYTGQGLPPSSVRPFIQIFSCRRITDLMDIQHFVKAMCHLPSLRTVRFHDVFCGIPTQFLAYCAEAPALRALELTDTQLTDLDRASTDAMSTISARSLAQFVYSINHWLLFMLAAEDRVERDRGLPFAIPSHGLHDLLEQMRDSLESLTISSHYGLFSWMSSVHWPRIRELCLDGMYLEMNDLHAVPSLVSNLPDLRVLSLNLARMINTERPQLVKEVNSSSMTFACFERFTIAYPNPRDGVFNLLPLGLRHLSLRDWPRYYFLSDRWMSPSHLDLAMPILTGSECLTILQRCYCPHLRSLEIVYRADDGEEALLRHIVASFPSLTTFELHRYRTHANDDIPMEHIIQILANLDGLRSLRLNLDLPNRPDPYRQLSDLDTDPVVDDMIYRTKRCAVVIGPCLNEVAFICRMHSKNEWIVWGIERVGEGAVSVFRNAVICDAECRNDIRGPVDER